MVLGEAIKSVRLYLELTQQEASERAGITQGFYSAIENGLAIPSVETLESISSAFELPLFWLICKATQQQDIPKNKRGIYNNIKPTINDILQEFIQQ
jgi:transcriptional regulator with XRE-family HTH domain